MSEVTHEMNYDSPNAHAAANSRAKDKNREGNLILTADPYGKRVPAFYVGIFNVGSQPFSVQRSWAVGGTVNIAARPKDALYSQPLILRDVENLQRIAPGSDEIQLAPTSGEYLAQDIVNCNNPYGSWKTYKSLDPSQAVNEGNNYYDRGIFWCRLATPTSDPDFEVVEFAITRLEKNYQRLVEEGNLLYQSGPKGQVLICAPHHEAAQYFIDAGHQLDLPWHATLTGGLSGRLKQSMAEKRAIKSKSLVDDADELT